MQSSITLSRILLLTETSVAEVGRLGFMHEGHDGATMCLTVIVCIVGSADLDSGRSEKYLAPRLHRSGDAQPHQPFLLRGSPEYQPTNLTSKYLFVAKGRSSQTNTLQPARHFVASTLTRPSSLLAPHLVDTNSATIPIGRLRMPQHRLVM